MVAEFVLTFRTGDMHFDWEGESPSMLPLHGPNCLPTFHGDGGPDDDDNQIQAELLIFHIHKAYRLSVKEVSSFSSMIIC